MHPAMTHSEHALMFDCRGESLAGVLSGAGLPAERGVVIVVGGPQYRVGSHRQFTLLARDLAGGGVPVLRFDYRGMGDSGGGTRTFESVGTDIRCAIDRFFASVPGLKDVVILGLCDAASAALFYAHQDARVSGVVLLNPWVRTQQGLARAHLRHYYVRRLFQASLWQKIARGEFEVRGAAAALRKIVFDAMGRRLSSGTFEESAAGESPLPDRMLDALRRFQGRVLLILSGNDLTAQEFKDVVADSSRWRRLLEDGRVTRRDLPEANHTFARRAWRDQVARWTEAWVKNL
jgi:exosortase A-associated hydrolase 1